MTTESKGEALELNKSRAEFEAEARKLDMPADALQRWPNGEYLNQTVDSYWQGWQLARRSLPVDADAVEAAAQAIYEQFPADRTGDAKTFPWQPGGNSFKQDEARRYARAALARASSAAPAAPTAELIEIGNRLADTVEVVAPAILNAGTTECLNRLVGEWREALAAPAAAQDAWISVDDARKPEERKPVLLFVRTLTRGEDDGGRPYEVEGEQVEMGEYRFNNGSPYFQCFVSPMSDNDWITHWMPLPVGPSEAKAGEDA